MLDKIDRLEKPLDIDDSMDIRLEPDVESGKDVLTVTGLSKSFDSQTLFTDVNFEIKRGDGWPSSATTVQAKPPS